jgi:hypothetical protein
MEKRVLAYYLSKGKSTTNFINKMLGAWEARTGRGVPGTYNSHYFAIEQNAKKHGRVRNKMHNLTIKLIHRKAMKPVLGELLSLPPRGYFPGGSNYLNLINKYPRPRTTIKRQRSNNNSSIRKRFRIL